MIRFELGEYDVEISAYNKIFKEHEKDTFYLLNQLCVVSGLAADAMRDQGYEALADVYQDFTNDLYRVCKEHGFYKEVEK